MEQNLFSFFLSASFLYKTKPTFKSLFRISSPFSYALFSHFFFSSFSCPSKAFISNNFKITSLNSSLFPIPFYNRIESEAIGNVPLLFSSLATPFFFFNPDFYLMDSTHVQQFVLDFFFLKKFSYSKILENPFSYMFPLFFNNYIFRKKYNYGGLFEQRSSLRQLSFFSSASLFFLKKKQAIYPQIDEDEAFDDSFDFQYSFLFFLSTFNKSFFFSNSRALLRSKKFFFNKFFYSRLDFGYRSNVFFFKPFALKMLQKKNNNNYNYCFFNPNFFFKFFFFSYKFLRTLTFFDSNFFVKMLFFLKKKHLFFFFTDNCKLYYFYKNNKVLKKNAFFLTPLNIPSIDLFTNFFLENPFFFKKKIKLPNLFLIFKQFLVEDFFLFNKSNLIFDFFQFFLPESKEYKLNFFSVKKIYIKLKKSAPFYPIKKKSKIKNIFDF